MRKGPNHLLAPAVAALSLGVAGCTTFDRHATISETPSPLSRLEHITYRESGPVNEAETIAAIQGFQDHTRTVARQILRDIVQAGGGVYYSRHGMDIDRVTSNNPIVFGDYRKRGNSGRLILLGEYRHGSRETDFGIQLTLSQAATQALEKARHSRKVQAADVINAVDGQAVVDRALATVSAPAKEKNNPAYIDLLQSSDNGTRLTYYPSTKAGEFLADAKPVYDGHTSQVGRFLGILQHTQNMIIPKFLANAKK